MILAGDIGATNTRLAWFEVADRALVRGRRPDLSEPAATRALMRSRRRSCAKHRGRPGRRASGSPGRCGTVGPRARTSRGPWTPGSSPAALGLDEVILLNDLEANAWGLATLRDTDFAVLQPGRRGADGQRRGHLGGDRARRGGPRVGRPPAPAGGLGGGSCRLGAPGRAADGALAVPVGRAGARQRGARALGPGAPQHLPIPARRAGPAPSPAGSPTSSAARPPPRRSRGWRSRAGPRSAPARSRSSWRSTGPRRATSGSACWRPAVCTWAAASRRASCPRWRAGRSSMRSPARGGCSPCSRRIPVRVVLNDQAALRGAARRAGR